jgi:hypothetical protein
MCPVLKANLHFQKTVDTENAARARNFCERHIREVAAAQALK